MNIGITDIMKLIRIFALSVIATVLSCYASYAQNQYRRSSLYSILVSHTEENFGKQIETAFLSIPIPDKFDNHDLSIKVIAADKKQVKESDISSFLKNNKVASRVVGKWFNRNPETGECDMALISQRGLYNASYSDIELAKNNIRGLSLLEDAGEELLSNTFVLVNEIHYFDKQKVTKGLSIFTDLAVTIAGTMIGVDTSDIGELMGNLVEKIKGFNVTVTSYLYRLDWNTDIAEEFYNTQYVAHGENNQRKRDAFAASDNYKLVYIGSQTVKSGEVTMKGLDTYDLGGMVLKVCTRSIDKSITALQKKYEEFRVKTPIFQVDKSMVSAKIGKKEGITESCVYEVLEIVEGKDGRTSYKRVGTVKPIKGRIWDNRYMAEFEDENRNSTLTATEFEIVSGSNFYPGMLLREIKL